MNRFRIALLSLSLIMSLGASADAGRHEHDRRRSVEVPYVDPSPYDPLPGDRFPGDRFPEYPQVPPGSGGNVERREIYVGRYLRDEFLPLDRLFNMNYQNYGDLIESVTVTLHDAGRGALTLTMDNYQVDFRSNLYRVEVLRPRERARFGIDFRTLGLRVSDKVFIEGIAINFIHQNNNPDPGGGNQGVVVLEQGIYQVYRGFGSLDVGQALDIYRYPNYRVLSVEIIGGAVGYQGGQATLLANSFEQGRAYFSNQNSGLQSIVMREPNQIGRDLNSLVLSISGDMRIDRVRVRLARPR